MDSQTTAGESPNNQASESVGQTPTPSLAVKLWTAKELRVEHSRIIRNRWITIGLGAIAIFVGGGFNSYDPSGFWGSCGGLLVLAGLAAIFGVINRSIGFPVPQLFSEPWTTPRNIEAFTAKWPNADISCPYCHQTVQVSYKRYQYMCEKCGIENNAYAFFIGETTPLEIFDKGLACWKCSQLNPLCNRTGWSTCPNCRSKVEWEHIPTPTAA